MVSQLNFILLFIISCHMINGQADLVSLHFLEGTWKAEDRNLYEEWNLDQDDLIGQSYLLKDGMKKVTEIVSITEVENEVLFTATVQDQNEGRSIPFKLVRISNAIFSFENPEHDFPQKIIYEKKSDDLVFVNVLGAEGKGFSYNMHKIEKPKSIPAWFIEDLENNIGTWIADNKTYTSDQEPFTAYGIEWTWGIGKTSIIGRLYALKNGVEMGDFWEFRQYWNNLKEEAVLIQFGNNGISGIGTITPLENGYVESIQVFSLPDGTKWEERHLNKFGADSFSSTSFEKDENQEWKQKRTYIWHNKK